MDHPQLTPEEIAALLGNVKAPAPLAVPARHGKCSIRQRSLAQKPTWLSATVRHELEQLHNTAAQDFTTSLAKWLRTWSEVKLLSINELSHEELASQFEAPTCFCLIQPSQPSEPCYLEINQQTVFPLVDRLLGGGQVPASVIEPRELTAIEARLMHRVASLWADQLCGDESDWKLKVERVTSRASDVEVLAANNVLAILQFEISFGEVRGAFHWCLSESVAKKLLGLDVGSIQRTRATNEDASEKESQWAQLSVHLPESELASEDVASLRIGDLIATEQDIDAPVVVCFDGRPAHQAALVACEGRKAVRIVAEVESEKQSPT
jgi:flagellar motor switch protein FliM